MRLDQVVLEQQRFAFGTRDRRFDARDLRDHRRGARMVIGLLKVARHALLQIARLADVERLAGGVEHAIDARPIRQRREQFAHVEWRSGRDGFGACAISVMSMPSHRRLRPLRAGDEVAQCAANTCSNIAVVRRRVLVL